MALILLSPFISAKAEDHPLSTSSDTFLQTAQWKTATPVFGQMKLVPSVTSPHAQVYDWKGPWSKFQEFQVEFAYSTGEQTSPGHFKFVEPSISLNGFTKKQAESHGTTVHLFDGASTVKDIHVETFKLPVHPKPNVEYKAAIITGEHAALQWTVYVRFQEIKPDYVR
jgi:hypothetical protein